MAERNPVGPLGIDPLAREILDALRGRPASGEIVLGGYVALSYHVDYRQTRDIDAWWRTGPKAETLAAIRQAMEDVAGRHGLELNERQWGEMVSFELSRENRKVFSFQIAVRSVEIEPPHESAWEPVLLESLADTVGAKMNALVGRGAPRDFTDIREMVSRGIVTVEECWRWWSLKNPGADARLAKAQVLRLLEALEQRRPLDEIQDPGERAAAREARDWIRRVLVGGDDVHRS
jgi:hypothetical protein